MGGLCRVVLPILVVYIISISVFECGWVGEAAGARKVELGLYYETLCPYCSNFIVKNLASIFRNGLLDVIQLNLVPYGNARVDSNNTISCQHGPYECMLNTVEACVINTFPDVHKHFAFIYCVESLVVEQKYAQWESCFQQTGLDSQTVVNCYNSGYGNKLELQYAAETNALEPPHKYVPWVLVDGQPLYEDYQNFAAYVCKAYKGDLPKACKALPIEMQEKKLNQFKRVSYFKETTHSSAVSVSQMEIKRPIWFDNVPHPKLVEYKKDQNWVQKIGDYLNFPGGGTQFKEGVTSYIQFIERILPSIEWGKHTRVILDVGCGVASFGGYLMEKGVLTMSFAPKDEHEAQIQFALERGIPAFLSVIGTQKLTFPDNVYDAVHCARCRVHWDADGGMPLLELNRILRPGGYFIWSATPVYRDDSRDQSVWNAMVTLTESICWKMVVKTVDSNGIGVVIYQKPVSNSCYRERKVEEPTLCDKISVRRTSWYVPLDSCLPQIPEVYSDPGNNWPKPWPERLNSKPSSFSIEPYSGYSEEDFYEDTKNWSTLVSDTYFHSFAINWTTIRNVMDMNAAYGGFAAALLKEPLWVLNTVPVNGPDTLPVIFDRGLIGIYHDWCEPFNTYPRTYDLLHSSFLFGNLSQRCDIMDVVVEMDRILRPGGWVLLQDTMPMIERLHPIMRSLHWDTTLHKQQFLVCRKGLWRPAKGGSES